MVAPTFFDSGTHGSSVREKEKERDRERKGAQIAPGTFADAVAVVHSAVRSDVCVILLEDVSLRVVDVLDLSLVKFKKKIPR